MIAPSALATAAHDPAGHRALANGGCCNVLVVGGGINGAGIARDLAGRGFDVVVVERHDLASHTSSSSFETHTEAAPLLSVAASIADLGAEVAPSLLEAELRHLQRDEWAHNAADLLWRRSKLGLHYTPAQPQAVATWLDRHRVAVPEPVCS